MNIVVISSVGIKVIVRSFIKQQGSILALANLLNATVLSTSFRKSFFCLTLYTEEVNMQIFVMI